MYYRDLNATARAMKGSLYWSRYYWCVEGRSDGVPWQKQHEPEPLRLVMMSRKLPAFVLNEQYRDLFATVSSHAGPPWAVNDALATLKDLTNVERWYGGCYAHEGGGGIL